MQHKALLITGVTTNPDIPSRHLKAILYIEMVMYRSGPSSYVPKWSMYRNGPHVPKSTVCQKLTTDMVMYRIKFKSESHAVNFNLYAAKLNRYMHQKL